MAMTATVGPNSTGPAWIGCGIGPPIVGQVEADASHGRISYNSPLGRALIGREAGEEVEVSAPAGDRSYEIKKVEFI